MEISPNSRTRLENTQAGPILKDKNIKSAAKEFEALLIGHLLESAFSAQDGVLSGNGDSGGQTMLDFGREHLARVISQGGGIGLASIVEGGLSRSNSRK
jgi:Rod binding domain-containing protein